jgi:prepilin-type N-terminal cleavage/methylation domain-containing protein
MSLRRSGSLESGFSLVEVVVAVTILLVGVLGVVAMVDGANAASSQNKAREGATSVARSIVEVGRAVMYGRAPGSSSRRPSPGGSSTPPPRPTTCTRV